MAKQKIKVIREEMLQVANNVAQEKNIDQESVYSAMEQALEKSARVKSVSYTHLTLPTILLV